MPSPLRSLLKHLVVLLLALLGGCSFVTVAYNNADTALYWFVDGYLDFSPTQRDLFQQGARRFHSWHRQSELRKYAELCSDAAGRVEAGLKPSDLDWLEAGLRSAYATLSAKAAPDLAGVLTGIAPAQLGAFDHKFAETNAKFKKEYLTGTIEAREKKRLAESLERIVDWVGNLEPEQEKRLTARLRALPQLAEHRYAQRLVRQKALRQILADKLDKDRLEAALHAWMLAWDSGHSAEHARAWALWLGQVRMLLLEIDATLTAAQRAHLAHKLRDYAEDFRRLQQQQ